MAANDEQGDKNGLSIQEVFYLPKMKLDEGALQ